MTMTDVNYHGSITIDSDLLKATGLLPNEAVVVADCDNGARFETYIIPGQPGSGVIGINGAAARLSKIGHKVIVMAFVWATPEEQFEIAKHIVGGASAKTELIPLNSQDATKVADTLKAMFGENKSGNDLVSTSRSTLPDFKSIR